MGTEHKTVSGEPDSCHPIVSLMANMMNYLNVSFYEGRFTYNHEQARAKLNELYDRLSKTPSISPSMVDSVEFYSNVRYLRNVTDTDHRDYAIYMRDLYQYVRRLESQQMHLNDNDKCGGGTQTHDHGNAEECKDDDIIGFNESAKIGLILSE
jgi:hypothetical protein